MKRTLHATRRKPRGAWRLVHAMSVWLVETRRAPSRRKTWTIYYIRSILQGLRMGRAGQHFELFDSIIGRVKKVTTHNHSLHVCTVCKVMPRVR